MSYRTTPRGANVIKQAVIVAAGVVAALLVWGVARLAWHEDLAAGISAGEQRVGPGQIVVAALVAGVAACLLRLALVGRGRGRTIWTAISGLTLLVSLAAPPSAGATGPDLLVLELLHLTVGAALLVGMHADWPVTDASQVRHPGEQCRTPHV